MLESLRLNTTMFFKINNNQLLKKVQSNMEKT